MALKQFSVKNLFSRGREELKKICRRRKQSANPKPEAYEPVQETPAVFSTVDVEPDYLRFTRLICIPIRAWMRDLEEDDCNWVYHQLLYEEAARDPDVISFTQSKSISERCKLTIAKRTQIGEWIDGLDWELLQWAIKAMNEVLREKFQAVINDLREGGRAASLSMYRLNTPRFPPLGWTAGRWIEVEDNDGGDDDNEEEIIEEEEEQEEEDDHDHDHDDEEQTENEPQTTPNSRTELVDRFAREEYEYERQMNEMLRNASSNSTTTTPSPGTESLSFGTDLDREATITNSRIQDVQESHPYRDLVYMDEVYHPYEDDSPLQRAKSVRFPRFSTPEPEEEFVFGEEARRVVTAVRV